jgi:uncharacterized membrane protein
MNMNKNKNVKWIVQAGIIAAIYAVATLALAPISYGPMQVRVSEALNILPYFTSAAVPGLFIGCLIANIFGSGFLIDIVLGSLATLVSAVMAYYLRKYKPLVPLPAVIVNAVVVGYILQVVYGTPFIVNMLWVGVGQIIACYGLGLPLLFGLEKYKDKIFKG